LRGEPLERLLVNTAASIQTFTRTRAQLVEGPAGSRHADDRHVEFASPQHRVQCGKDLLVREISCRTEENKGIRTG
jgi:hypothetical protein